MRLHRVRRLEDEDREEDVKDEVRVEVGDHRVLPHDLPLAAGAADETADHEQYHRVGQSDAFESGPH